MTTKQCSKCGETKPVSEFHKNRAQRDGLQTMCKDCKKAQMDKRPKGERLEVVRRWRAAHPEKSAESSRRYHLAHPGRSAAGKRRARAANPEKARAEWRRERMENPGKTAASVMRYAAKYPERKKAAQALYYAIKQGKIIKGQCFVCGTNKRIHGHHEDYSKPYDVVWLCPRCHTDYHVAFNSSPAPKP